MTTWWLKPANTPQAKKLQHTRAKSLTWVASRITSPSALNKFMQPLHQSTKCYKLTEKRRQRFQSHPHQKATLTVVWITKDPDQPMTEASIVSMRYHEAATGRFTSILLPYPGNKALKVLMLVAKDTFWQTIHWILVWHAQLAKVVAAPAARLRPIKTSNTYSYSPIISYSQKCPTSKVSS